MTLTEQRLATAQHAERVAGDGWRALAIFVVLLSVYVFTASGRFHSDDELSVWAAAASLAGRGEVTIDQLAWNQDLGGGVGRAMPNGQVFSKYGLGGSLAIVPLLWLAGLIPWAGAGQLAMTLDLPVTAATGALVYLICRRLGGKPTASALVALGYGLATLAWVYARYLFGEPLVALGWVAAFWLLLPRERSLPWWMAALAGVAVAGSVLVRTAGAITVPVLLPLLWAAGGRIRGLMAYAAPIAAGLLGIAAYNLVRFGNPLDSGYNPIESFTAPFGEGLAGLLVSPGRGLLWYAPPVILALPGLVLLWRRSRAAALTIGLVVLANVALYGKWHAWHGGWGWGPRLLLPVVPLLLVAALPVVERAFERGGWAITARAAIAVLGIAGAAVTLLGVLVDFNRFLLELLAQRPEMAAGVLFLTLNDWALSPIPNHLRLLFTGAPDLLWAVDAGVFVPIALASALGVLLALRLWLAAFGAAIGRLSLSIYATLALAALSVAGAHAEYARWRYDDISRDIAAAVEQVRQDARPGDRLLAVEAGHAEPLLNRAPLRMPITQILPEGTPITPQAGERIQRSVQGSRLWLLQAGAQPVGDDNGIETRVDSLAYKVDAQQFGTVRLTRYATGDGTPGGQPVDFGDRLRLTGWAASPAEGVLRVDLAWHAVRAPGARFVVSLRLVDSTGKTAVQRDRELTDGAHPTADWQAGEDVRERLGIALPAGLAPGTYHLQAVVYSVGGGKALPVGSGEVADLGPVQLGGTP